MRPARPPHRGPLLALLCALGCVDAPPPAPDRAARLAALREAVGPDWDRPVVGLSAANLSQGQDIYGKSCGPCHGVALDGRGPRAAGLDPAPSPLVGPGSGELPPAAELHVIRRGSPGTAMAPFGRGLSDDQLLDVLAYVHAQRAAAPPPAAPPAIRPPG